MVEKIKSALDKLFQQHRLVLWYDDKADMNVMFESLALDGVQKLVISNNEFGIKYRVLVGEPENRFLIYQPSPKPADNENWLLDLNLAYYEFRTEASSLYLQDLELPQEFKPVIQAHEEFFADGKRLLQLKALLEKDDRESKVRLKMLSILCSCEPEWEKVLYSLFEDLANGKDERYERIKQYKLDAFFWEITERKYGYKSPSATIKDLLLRLLVDNFQRYLPKGKPTLTKDAHIFVNRWKENTKAQITFELLSNQIAEQLGIESTLEELSTDDLMDANTFEAVDKKIILGLRDSVLKETLSNQAVHERIDKRIGKFFYKSFEHIYEALSYASTLLDEVNKSQLKIADPEEGFQKYAKQFYKIDFLYRKYIYFSENAEHQNILKEVTAKIEKAYSNSFLVPLGDSWQQAIDGLESWQIQGIRSQREFYDKYVQPYVTKENRLFVIISDALRYESAVELREIILKEDRYTAELHTMLCSLPSYTQLGMASLLPHQSLTFNNNDDTVFADGASTRGVENRTKILQARHVGSIAISAEDFLKMNAKDSGREFVKQYQVVYIYSNGIDKIGDDKVSEHKVFDATEDEFVFLIRIMKQIANMNGTNMIVTADHGYLYQHNRLEESDFTAFEQVDGIVKASRRFLIGRNLQPAPAFMKFSGSHAGFADETDVLVPKSINRLRVPGSGSRYVHGGASLQEIVLPVIEINKKRKSDVDKVEVDIIGGATNITSNQFGINFYQKQPVGEKVLPRQLRVGFYTVNGKLISDVITLTFNTTEKDSTGREKRHTFLFVSDSTQFNNQEVTLRLEELIEDTTQFRLYKEFKYRMLISFGSEFDDF